MRTALAEIESSDGQSEEASEGDSFVDIMGGLEGKIGGESEGFTFEDALQLAALLSDIVLESVVNSLDLPLC